MDVSQIDIDIETMKDLMVICNNNIHWNSVWNMIKCALHLCHRINAFYTVNQYLSKQIWEKNDDDGSIYRDILTLGDWETLEELYNLTKPFRDFTARMEGHALTGSYGALWKVLPAIELLVTEYKKYDSHYTALVLNNRVLEAKREEPDMEYSYILLCVKNALNKLMKYQELLPQLPVYAAAITINPTFHW